MLRGGDGGSCKRDVGHEGNGARWNWSWKSGEDGCRRH